MLVSFVIPCYHSEKTIEGVVNEIDAAMKELPQYTHEIIMVNDGVPNECWNEIRRICQAVPENAPDGKRLGICLARNFGQHAALMAGIRASKGEQNTVTSSIPGSATGDPV